MQPVLALRAHSGETCEFRQKTLRSKEQAICESFCSRVLPMQHRPERSYFSIRLELLGPLSLSFRTRFLCRWFFCSGQMKGLINEKFFAARDDWN
jgi:hypothetical protein